MELIFGEPLLMVRFQAVMMEAPAVCSAYLEKALFQKWIYM